MVGDVGDNDTGQSSHSENLSENVPSVPGFPGLKWKLRRQTWFWIAITVSAALHVPLILFVPWTTRWVPALAVMVGAMADFFLILWILLVVEKFMEGSIAPEGPSIGQ